MTRVRWRDVNAPSPGATFIIPMRGAGVGGPISTTGSRSAASTTDGPTTTSSTCVCCPAVKPGSDGADEALERLEAKSPALEVQLHPSPTRNRHDKLTAL